MKKTKTIIAAIILLLIFVVGGTFAFFTDTTDEVTNTFTIGSVSISLTEPGWTALADTDDNNIPDDAENMMPGESVTKDPTINNTSTKSPAFVFIKVQVPCTTETTPQEIFTYTLNAGWTELTIENQLPVACSSGGNATHVYYYGSNGQLSPLAKATSASVPTPTTNPLFSTITLRGTLKGDEGLDGQKNIVLKGYGIQTEGLTSTAPASVWGNFN